MEGMKKEIESRLNLWMALAHDKEDEETQAAAVWLLAGVRLHPRSQEAQSLARKLVASLEHWCDEFIERTLEV